MVVSDVPQGWCSAISYADKWILIGGPPGYPAHTVCLPMCVTGHRVYTWLTVYIRPCAISTLYERYAQPREPQTCCWFLLMVPGYTELWN